MGSRAPGPACFCASLEARLPDISIPMASGCFVLHPGPAGGVGVGWGQGTINLPASVCGRGCVGRMGAGVAVFLEARLGLRQRQKRGRNRSSPASFLPPFGNHQVSGSWAQATTSDRRRLRSVTSGGSAQTSSCLTDFKSG